MNITLLNKTVSTETGKNGKPYQMLEVAFKNNTFQGKVEGKKITSYSKPAFDVLVEAEPGTTFEVTVEKKNGFNEWTALTRATPEEGRPAAAQPRGVSGTTPAPKSNYETTEERARRQTLITRQSSLSTAVATLSVGSKSVDPAAVMDLAEKYNDWVHQKGVLTGFESMNDDDPSVGVNIV